MRLPVSAEEPVRPGDGWPRRSEPKQPGGSSLEALAGGEHTGTAIFQTLLLSPVCVCVSAVVTRAAFSDWIRKSLQIYEVVENPHFPRSPPPPPPSPRLSKIVHFHNRRGLTWHDLCLHLHYGRLRRWKNYEWFLSLNLVHEGCQVQEMLIFHIMYLVQ